MLASAAALAGSKLVARRAWAQSVTLPLGNGERPLVQVPQKRLLIRVTERPPQLETPFAVFDGAAITPNDVFFVRYHLADIPRQIDPEAFRLEIDGKVKTPRSLSLEDLEAMPATEVIAVNQCSGNSRGASSRASPAADTRGRTPGASSAIRAITSPPGHAARARSSGSPRSPGWSRSTAHRSRSPIAP